MPAFKSFEEDSSGIGKYTNAAVFPVSYTHLSLKSAATPATCMCCIRFCAKAPNFENIEPRKTAANAVSLWPPATASWYNG